MNLADRSPHEDVIVSGPTYVYPSWVPIKGRMYLCGFSDGRRRVGYPPGREIGARIPRQITSIKYTIGLYGIRRVKAKGQSDESEWIGGVDQTDPGWTGVVKVDTSAKIRLFWDVSTTLRSDRSGRLTRD